MPVPKIKYPCADGWDSQKYSDSHKGIDIGWLSYCSKNGRTAIYACDDGEIVFEGYYSETIKGKVYKPIGVIIKHDWDTEYDYYSIYWHLSCTVINKGDKVVKGQKIGNKGTTGKSTGVHLHFQIIKVPKGEELPTSDKWSAISIDPTPYIEVYDDQVFDYRGNYNLAKHVEDPEEESEELRQLRQENAELKEKLNKIKEIVV